MLSFSIHLWLSREYKDYIDRNGDVNRHYRNVYPSLSVSYRKKGWVNTVSFSSKTTRPTFRQLSNASYYMNEYMYQKGNPLLKPSKTYTLQWNSGYDFIHFSAGYTIVKDYIAMDSYTPQPSVNQIVSSFTNYDNMQYLKAELNLQKNISWWMPSFSAGVIRQFFGCEYLGKEIAYEKPQVYLVFNQYFRLPKSYMLNMYYYLNTGGDQGIVRFKPYQMLNVGLTKSFLNDKLSVSLKAQDVFHTLKFKETYSVKNISFSQTEEYSWWHYSLSIIYRLNQKKMKYRGKTSIEDEINRL